MECKVYFPSPVFAGGLDLIETLWNVKNLNCSHGLINAIDLIETLWNVKIFSQNKQSCTSGFNRDIVECKGC